MGISEIASENKNPHAFNGEVITRNFDEESKRNIPKSSKIKKLYIESYGCQMTSSDSEIVVSI